MAGRAERLKKLLAVQEQIKGMHEMRHAGFAAAAVAASAEAAEIAARFDGEGSLSGLFPEVYNRRIANALARADENAAQAAEELRRVAVATARAKLVARDHRQARDLEERTAEDRERLESISAARQRG